MERAVTIANFRTKLDAEVAGGILAEHQIPYVIQSAEGMLHGPISPGADLLVPADTADWAHTLLLDAGVLGES